MFINWVNKKVLIVVCKLTILLLLGNTNLSWSQYFSGFANGNYAGVAGAIVQPATVVMPGTIDTHGYKMDAIFFGINVFADNNGAMASRSNPFLNFDISSFDFSLNERATNKYAFGVVEIVLPSLMWQLTDKHAMAFTPRIRTVFNVNETEW